MNACRDCRFFRQDPNAEKKLFRAEHQCRRYAPKPFDFVRFYELELLRALAWAAHHAAGLEAPSEDDDLSREATEAHGAAVWPQVEYDDGCGEWEALPCNAATVVVAP